MESRRLIIQTEIESYFIIMSSIFPPLIRYLHFNECNMEESSGLFLVSYTLLRTFPITRKLIFVDWYNKGKGKVETEAQGSRP